MGRTVKEKGDRKVETWNHSRSGLTCEIYLRGTKFVATFLEREYSAPDVAILRRTLNDVAEHWIELEWFGVIEISVSEPDRLGRGRRKYNNSEGESLEFKRERYWLSQSPAGEVFKCEWDVDERHRKAEMQSLSSGYRYGGGGDTELARLVKLTGLPLGAPVKGRSNEVIIDYDPTLWDKFTGIIENLAKLRDALHELCASKKGLAILRDGNPALLLRDEN